MTDEEAAFERGRVIGQLTARLDGHDKHFEVINGSLEEIARALTAATVAIQTISVQLETKDKMMLAVSTALKESEVARVAEAENRWRRVAKVFAVVTMIATLLSIISTILAIAR